MKAGRIFIVGLSWVVVMGWGMEVMAQMPDTLWTRTYGNDRGESAYSMIQAVDGGLVLAGVSCEGTNIEPRVYFVKTDASGNFV